MREHDAPAIEARAIRHERLVRDVNGIVPLVGGREVRRLADEQVCAARHLDELVAPARVARIRDQRVADAHAQPMRLRRR